MSGSLAVKEDAGGFYVQGLREASVSSSEDRNGPKRSLFNRFSMIFDGFSMDFRWIFDGFSMDFHGFSWIFMDFRRFSFRNRRV